MTRTPQTISTPRNIDALLAELNAKLVTAFSGINTAFGKAEVLDLDQGNGYRTLTPVIYSGQNEYIDLLPDDTRLKTYSFFIIEDSVTRRDPDDYTQYYSFDYEASFIIWFEYADLYLSPDGETIENVRHDFYNFFQTVQLTKGSITPGTSYATKENVFSGFDITGVSGKFWLRPYGCLRIDLQLTTQKTC